MEADNPKKGTAEIIVAKNRNYATGTVFMHFHEQYTRFEDLAPDSYQEFELRKNPIWQNR
jgi:replicative DNA helicase